jgi:putative zinc finger/helix-turn-helix YgiT family protein
LSRFENCPACGSPKISFTKGHYHFLESGLNNVHLNNVDTWTCDDCGEKIISIPRSMELMKSICEIILLKPMILTSEEIRFLRKNLSLKINEFARLLGMDRVTVSRWENGHEIPSRSADRLMRLTYAVEANIPEDLREQLRRSLRREETDSEVDYFVSLPLAS